MEVQDKYLACIAEIKDTPPVRSMGRFMHHPHTTTLAHTLFVSYIAFRIAYAFRWDYRACARAGLMHDMHLYDWRDPTQFEGWVVTAHPRDALKNAEKLVTLTEKERNIISTHMWPLARHMPKSREAFVVCMCDKICCVLETVGYLRRAKHLYIVSLIKEMEGEQSE